MVLGEFRKELGVYNKTINNYIKTFDLVNYCRLHVVNPNSYGEIRDYQEIDEELIDFLLLHKDKLKEYQRDYYSAKTISQLSKKIEIDEGVIIKYFQTNLKRYLSIYDIDDSEVNFERKRIGIITGGSTGIDNKLYNSRCLGVVSSETKILQISSYNVFKAIQTKKLHQMIENYITKKS